jgi:hypothetical protein
MLPYTYEQLMRPLELQPLGRRLAHLSVQTKIEKFILAEIVHAGVSDSMLEFRLEEARRDLTVRTRGASGARGHMLEWVEAKMCYSECVARTPAMGTERRINEYLNQLRSDATKQRKTTLPDEDREAVLTTALFVIHRAAPHPRHAYYPRERIRCAAELRAEAVRHCTEDIPRGWERSIAERVELKLDEMTEMLCFFYRGPGARP